MSSVVSAHRASEWEEGSAWRQRQAQASSEDMVRGLFLRSSLRAIRAMGDEALAQACVSACGQARFFDFFSYPVRIHLEMMATAVPVLALRHRDLERCLWMMGHCVAMDFLDSEPGRAIQVLVRGEAKRLVNNLPSTYQLSINGERSVKWMGPQCCRLTMRRDFLPTAFHEGMLVAMLEGLQARRVRVSGRALGLLDSEYDLTWQ